MEVVKVLNLKGLSCPMPIIRTKQEIDRLNSGEVLEVHVTDQGALTDLPAWAKAGGHKILEHREESDGMMFFIQKG